MNDKAFNISLLVFCFVLGVGMVYVILDGPLADEMFAEPLYLYSVLLYALAAILTLLIIRRCRSFPPSTFLIASFLAVPIIGPIGYEVFVKIYGSFHDIHLSFEYPTFVWMVGTAALAAGILVTHLFVRKARASTLVLWNLQRTSRLLWVTVGISGFFTIYVLLKIGYIPVLSGNIDDVRKSYESIAGDYPLKLSRFWLIAASIASMLFFIRNRKWLDSVVVAVSSLALLIYGQRTYAFLVVVLFALIYFKFRKPGIVYLSAFGLSVIVAFVFYADFRGGRSFKDLSVPEIVTLNLFGEWREYALVVNDLKRTGAFYESDLYLGALAPVLPKQVWAAFGIDKDDLVLEKNAVYIFGREFGNDLGIRIGTIGEAYAGYGIFYGVCLQMFLFGLIFGGLETFYLRLDRHDARLCLVCFLLALLVSLPITTLYVTMAHAVFFGFFFVVFQIAATSRMLDPRAVVAVRGS